MADFQKCLCNWPYARALKLLCILGYIWRFSASLKTHVVSGVIDCNPAWSLMNITQLSTEGTSCCEILAEVERQVKICIRVISKTVQETDVKHSECKQDSTSTEESPKLAKQMIHVSQQVGVVDGNRYSCSPVLPLL